MLISSDLARKPIVQVSYFAPNVGHASPKAKVTSRFESLRFQIDIAKFLATTFQKLPEIYQYRSWLSEVE